MKLKLIKHSDSLINNSSKEELWVQLDVNDSFTSMNSSLKKAADYIVEGLCKFRKHRPSFSDFALQTDWSKVNDIVSRAASSNAINWEEVVGVIIDERMKSIKDAKLGIIVKEGTVDYDAVIVTKEEIVKAIKSINENIGEGFYGV